MTLVANVIGRKKFLSTVDNDQPFLLLSDVGKNAGMWTIQFVPDPGFDGDLFVMGRIQGQAAYEDGVAFEAIPYRAAILNGAESDYTTISDNTAITGFSLIHVPATRIAVALMASITSGTGVIYSYPAEQDSGLP